MARPQIDVSTDLYTALERLREPQDKTISDLLWRLVEERGLARTEPTSAERGRWQVPSGEGLHCGDTTISNGSRLRGRYRGGEYAYASVEGGKIVLEGAHYDSPSGAARAVLALHGVVGAAGNVNGWKFWEMEYPTGSGRWRRLDTCRQPWQVRRHRW